MSISLPASPAAAAAIEAPRPAIHTTELPVALVAMDAEVRADFLGSDIEVICAVAAKTGSTLLITTAGQPLEQREAAFAIWRRRGLENLAVAFPAVRALLAKNEELRFEYDAGSIDLLILDRLLHDAREAERQHRSEHLAASKQALRDAVAKHVSDDLEGRFPRYCIIRGLDGEMKLFRSRPAAMEWAREGNAGYHLIPLDTAQREYKPAEYPAE